MASNLLSDELLSSTATQLLSPSATQLLGSSAHHLPSLWSPQGPERRGGGGSAWFYGGISPGDHFLYWLTFLIVALSATVVTPLVARTGMPSITGYIIVGAICGPYVLEIISEKGVKSLEPINSLALSYITTAAGAELIIGELKPMLKGLLAQITTKAVLLIAMVTIVVRALASTSLLSFTNTMDSQGQWAIALTTAAIGLSNSPATAIAIVKEMKCKGKLTTTFLGLTVLTDVYVLVATTIALAFTDSVFSGIPFDAKNIFIVLAMIVASVLLGIPIGMMFMGLMKAEHPAVHIMVFPLGYLVFLGCEEIGKALASVVAPEIKLSLEPLLMCIVAGFICVNYSKYRYRFTAALHAGEPVVFVPFFVLVGASLDLTVFVRSIGFAFIVALTRAFCIFVGTGSAGYLIGQEKRINLTVWMTLLPQAGFSLGMAAQVGAKYDGWGKDFQAAIISCVIVNQFFGPLLAKLALKMSGEAGLATGHEAEDELEADKDARHFADEHKAMIVGVNDRAKAVALSLLRQKWGVVMVCPDEGTAAVLEAEVREWAVSAREDDIAFAEMVGIEPPPQPAVPMEERFYARSFDCINGEMTNEMRVSLAAMEFPDKKPSSVPEADEATLSGPAGVEPEVAGEGGQKFGPSAAESENPGPAPMPRLQSAGSGRSSLDMPRLSMTGSRTSVELLPRLSSTGSRTSVELPFGSRSDQYTRYHDLFDVLDSTEGLTTIILGLGDDLQALKVLDAMQEHLATNHTHKHIRFLVLMQEMRWAEAFGMMDATPLHDFVSSMTVANIASTTPYKKEFVLAPSVNNEEEMSEEFLRHFDGAILEKCSQHGRKLKMLGTFDKASITNNTPTMKMLTKIQEKMKQRKSKISGGALLQSIEEWIERNIDPEGAKSNPEVRMAALGLTGQDSKAGGSSSWLPKSAVRRLAAKTIKRHADMHRT